jgi:hypothetical protein
VAAVAIIGDIPFMLSPVEAFLDLSAESSHSKNPRLGAIPVESQLDT